ncbi:MAG: isoprenylcysteine carboxylmethyltransferase family protein [Deltaproteobacteria bacterium]|nr:isoprenylcysteine carboxylmethyltransferase family protein [Deltaproteobacteria bacterium]
MSEESTAGRKPLIPPVILAGLLVIATALHFAWEGWASLRLVWLGVPLAVAGLGVNVVCSRMMKRHQTTIKPHERPSTLLRSGPYRYCRNPIYLGGLLALAGLALCVGTLPFYLIIPVMWAVLRLRYVPMEEANLQQAFGGEYTAYCQEVPRGI